jgi:hypothetical protein
MMDDEEEDVNEEGTELLAVSGVSELVVDGEGVGEMVDSSSVDTIGVLVELEVVVLVSEVV